MKQLADKACSMEENPRSKVIYLHIGMHKTGTTALQKFLSANDSILANHGVCYPKTGRGRAGIAHHDIANSLKGPPFPLREPDCSPEEYLAGIRDCFNAFPTLLLSSEIFMRFVPAFRDRLALKLSKLERLLLTADTVKVIIYLRRQDQYLESFYCQEIQHDLYMSFPEFASARLPDYFQICSELAEVFGKDNVVVRVYDRTRFKGGTIFSDILSVLNIDLSAEFSLPNRDENPSLMPDEREFRMLINAFNLPINEVIRFNKPLIRLSAQKRSSRTSGETGQVILSPPERLEFLKACAATNARVAQTFVTPEGSACSLFPDATGATKEHAAGYPGLSDEALMEIVGYIKGVSPELITLLSTAVDNGLLSNSTVTQCAARKLELALT